MKNKYTKLYVYGSKSDTELAQTYAQAIEEGRWIARDLCGADPEVITPTKFVEYVNTKFPASDPDIQVERTKIDATSHPMMAAVERANEGSIE